MSPVVNPDPKPTLVIGDLHGHLSRLEDILEQEGIIASCGLCTGLGDLTEAPDPEFCPACRGLGMVRVNHTVEVVQLGDLGDLRAATQGPDSLCWLAADLWLDTVLWGNHERPIIGGPIFGGYWQPLPEVRERMLLMRHENRLKLAHAAHGFLLTHAGMPDHYFGGLKTGSLKRSDAEAVARWINRKDRERPHKFSTVNTWDLRDAIGPRRGGYEPSGGLLWRDDLMDPLWNGLPQVYGHTSDQLVRVDGSSYNVDLSKHGGVGAVWLPERRVVTVRDEELVMA